MTDLLVACRCNEVLHYLH